MLSTFPAKALIILIIVMLTCWSDNSNFPAMSGLVWCLLYLFELHFTRLCDSLLTAGHAVPGTGRGTEHLIMVVKSWGSALRSRVGPSVLSEPAPWTGTLSNVLDSASSLVGTDGQRGLELGLSIPQVR